ncbi:MAG TPA: hypothetical protein VM243_21025 [Phycisphaerae bacterium]|nr:hypothetical protein [Phycisphaerae bacterium]
MSDLKVVVCPNCLQKYRVRATQVGRRAVCKTCGQRFKIAEDQKIDDDTIFGWVTADDPAGNSVLGGTGILTPPPAEKPAAAAQWRRPPPPDRPRVKFDRIDEIGAYFEFPAFVLDDPDLRCAFPHRCVHCLTPKDLTVHVMIWGDKLPRSDALRLNEAESRTVRKLDELMARDPLEWFDKLDPIGVLPPPYSNPFPYYVCGQCSPIGEVICHVLDHEGIEHCQVAIANLTIAVDFYRNNGGRKEPAYQKILVASRLQQDNQWQQLPFAVRAKISQWFTQDEGESFLGYYPDEAFSRSETGTAGLILTDRRMVYKKYASRREYKLDAAGTLFIEATRAAANIEISQEGERDAMVTIKPLAAGNLARRLGEAATTWQIRVTTSDS